MDIKVRRRTNNNFMPDDYVKVANPSDYNDLALLFEDMDLLFNAPIEKAFLKYKERKGGAKGYPYI